MTWNVAAGVIIGGLILMMIRQLDKPGWDPADTDEGNRRYAGGRLVINIVIGLLGIGLAIWVLIFKANL